MFFFLHNVNKNVVCYFVIRLLIWLRKSLASSQRVLNWFRGHLAKCLNGKIFYQPQFSALLSAVPKCRPDLNFIRSLNTA